MNIGNSDAMIKKQHIYLKKWINQNQLAKLFDTSVPDMSMHIANMLKESELEKNSVIKNFLTTASEGKRWEEGCEK